MPFTVVFSFSHFFDVVFLLDKLISVEQCQFAVEFFRKAGMLLATLQPYRGRRYSGNFL